MMYRKFFIRLFVVAVLLILTDVTIGGFFSHFYTTCRYGIFGRQVYCFTRSNEDILILGPSTASHHYVPSILSDSLGMSCFNAGSDGMAVYYHYGVLSSYKDDRKPRLVLYDIGALDWYKSKELTFTLDAALDRLAPHYRQTPEIDSLFALNGWSERVKQWSLLYRYNSKLVQLIKCHRILSYEDAGYEALNGALAPGTVPGTKKGGGIIEENKVNYLQKLIDYTRANGIGLVMVISPRYYSLGNDDFKTGKEIAARNGIPVIDMLNAPELMKPEYFADESHLNDIGARLFTSFVGKEVRKLIGEGNELI